MRKKFEQTFHVIDIETVPNEEAIKSVAWENKKKRNEKLTDHDAGLDPIFGQIICIADSFIHVYINNYKLSIEPCLVLSSSEVNEQGMMNRFCDYLKSLDKNNLFVAHNGKGFDYHFLAKRIMAHGLQLPESLQLAGLKPWNIKHVDTMELMQMGSNQYTSLESLCYLFDEPTPKDAMDGSEVWDYFKAGKLREIAMYCEKDVKALRNIFVKMIKQGVYKL